MTDANASMDLGAALEPLRPGLRLHCYRMLGSSHDSDDMVQEAMLRAWRARGSLEDPARVKPWLYRIATNACLDELRSRSRRGLAVDIAAPVPGDSFPPAAPIEDAAWLEPMPNAWLAGCGDDPEARYTLRESVALAFVAALQVLSPTQRATLLLRDVVGLSAEETAAALEQSVSAANSVLHRARAALEDKVVGRDPAAFAAALPEPVPERRGREDQDDKREREALERRGREDQDDKGEREALERYMRALEAHDIDAMIALLHDEVHTTMPPSPTWVAGYADNAVFYRHMFARWGDDPIRLVPIGVNGGAGFEFHRGGTVRAIEAAEVRDGKIFRMHHFMQPAVVALFTSPSR